MEARPRRLPPRRWLHGARAEGCPTATPGTQPAVGDRRRRPGRGAGRWGVTFHRGPGAPGEEGRGPRSAADPRRPGAMRVGAPAPQHVNCGFGRAVPMVVGFPGPEVSARPGCPVPGERWNPATERQQSQARRPGPVVGRRHRGRPAPAAPRVASRRPAPSRRPAGFGGRGDPVRPAPAHAPARHAARRLRPPADGPGGHHHHHPSGPTGHDHHRRGPGDDHHHRPPEPPVTTTSAPPAAGPVQTAAGSATGQATWYAEAPPGGCASPSLPPGTEVQVVDDADGASTSCVVDDREATNGGGRLLDLSVTGFSSWPRDTGGDRRHHLVVGPARR